MKTNLLKSAIIVAALSFAFTACENNPIVNDVESGLEKKKANVEQIRPNENHNDRELERNILKELPVKTVTKPSNTQVVSKNSEKVLQQKIQTNDTIQ